MRYLDTFDGNLKFYISPGSIARSRCGLKIGWGQDFESFEGCIDKVCAHNQSCKITLITSLGTMKFRNQKSPPSSVSKLTADKLMHKVEQ